MNHEKWDGRGHVADKIGGGHIHGLGGDVDDQIGNDIRQFFFRDSP